MHISLQKFLFTVLDNYYWVCQYWKKNTWLKLKTIMFCLQIVLLVIILHILFQKTVACLSFLVVMYLFVENKIKMSDSLEFFFIFFWNLKHIFILLLLIKGEKKVICFTNGNQIMCILFVRCIIKQYFRVLRITSQGQTGARCTC